jgi:hypothetical protein
MRLWRQIVFAVALFCLGVGANAAAPKPLFVHYMPWFRAKPFNSTWGYHWTLNRFNPDVLEPSGQRQIGAHYYPLIGPYDSLDPAVLEYHVLLMKLAGIDGVIPDWYGPANFADYATINSMTGQLFVWTRRAGLQFAVCYEDQTILHMIENSYIPSSQAIAQAQGAMRYLQTNYFTDPSYFKIAGAPVLLDFGPAYFTTSADWQTIFSVLPLTPAFFPEENRFAVAAGAFPWPPMWKSNQGVLSLTDLRAYLTDFETKAKTWPHAVSGAFPRFNDDYAQSLGVLADNNGATFQETLRRAITNRSDFVQIVTWNDFGEGTVVEPTVEFGYRDLGVIQDFRRQYLDPSFSVTTNDLPLAFRLYSLRRTLTGNAAATGGLNRAFTNIVQGRLASASSELTAIEMRRPLFFDAQSSGQNLTFSIGGYLAPTGGVVQVYTDANPAWQNLQSIPASSVAPVVQDRMDSNTGSVFYRVLTGP